MASSRAGALCPRPHPTFLTLACSCGAGMPGLVWSLAMCTPPPAGGEGEGEGGRSMLRCHGVHRAWNRTLCCASWGWVWVCMLSLQGDVRAGRHLQVAGGKGPSRCGGLSCCARHPGVPGRPPTAWPRRRCMQEREGLHVLVPRMHACKECAAQAADAERRCASCMHNAHMWVRKSSSSSSSSMLVGMHACTRQHALPPRTPAAGRRHSPPQPPPSRHGSEPSSLFSCRVFTTPRSVPA